MHATTHLAKVAWRRVRRIAAALPLIIGGPVPASGALAPESMTPSPVEVTPAPIEVTVADGRLTLEARAAPLADVLQAIGEEGDFAILIKGDFSAPITRSLNDVPLEPALADLLSKGVILMKLHDADSTGKDGPRLVEIRLYGSFEPQTRSASDAGTPADDHAELAANADGAPDEAADRTDAADLDPEPAETDGDDAGNRVDYIAGLAGMNDTLTVDILAGMLADDSSAQVRAEAARALANIGGEDADKSLESALGDPAAPVRAEVLKGLVAVGARDSELFLGQAIFGDRDVRVRRTAVQSLAAIPGDASRAFLEAARHDTDPAVRALAEQALDAGNASPEP